MTDEAPDASQPSRSDTWLAIVASALLGVFAAVYAGALIFEAFSTGTFRVEIPIANAPASIPVGRDESEVAASVTRALVEAPGVAGIVPVLFVAATVVTALAWALVALQFVGLVRSFGRGRVFRAGNARRLTLVSALLWLTAISALVVDRWVVGPVVAAVGGGSLDTAFREPPTYLLLAGAAIGIGLLAGAFHRGERLQRDTDGLV